MSKSTSDCRRRVLVSRLLIAALACTAGVLAWNRAGIQSSEAAPPGKKGSTGTTPTGAVTLYGVVRDFRAANVRDGHPDFGSTPAQGAGIYLDIAADTLNAQGDPVFQSTGYKVTTQSMDSQSRPKIDSKNYIEARSGDVAAVKSSSEGGAVATTESFADWYRDNPMVNASASFTIPLQSNNGVLSYDGDLRTQNVDVQGFGGNKVFGYTFEVECSFVQPQNATQLKFGADDCLWVYIDGKLVIDLGGEHSYVEQTLDLSRLTWLTPGQTYSMKIFYAERDKSGSRFHIESAADLRPIDPPAVSGLLD